MYMKSMRKYPSTVIFAQCEFSVIRDNLIYRDSTVLCSVGRTKSTPKDLKQIYNSVPFFGHPVRGACGSFMNAIILKSR